MSVLDVLRRLILAHHEEEHRAISQSLADDQATLSELEVRIRRLEIERRLRERRLS